MNAILNKNLFLIKEHDGMFKTGNSYDIYDPESNELLLNCREINLSLLTKIMRFTKDRSKTPFNFEITTTSGEKLLTIKKGWHFFLSKIEVLNGQGQLIGFIKQNFKLVGGKFEIVDKDLRPVCLIKGDWASWDFKFAKETCEIAQVNKKWDGIGKELFTTTDNYVLQILDEKSNEVVRQLVMASVLCIDMVLNE